MQKYWDPIDGELSENSAIITQLSGSDLDEKFEHLLKNPSEPKWYFWSLLSFGILSSLFLYYEYRDYRFGYVRILVYLLLPVLIYYRYIKELERKLVELLIAKENNWLYNPNKDRQKWIELKILFGEIFNKGDRAQFVFRQFWGSIGSDNVMFWKSRFKYTIGSKKSSHTVTETVYAFKLPKIVAENFLLVPQNFKNRLKTSINLKITTESNDFNKIFHIEYRGKTNDVGDEIFEVLSPDVQDKLINFRKSCGKFSLLFKKDTMLVVFEKDIKLKYSNFLKKVAFDERDMQEMNRLMSSTVKLGGEVLSCLD